MTTLNVRTLAQRLRQKYSDVAQALELIQGAFDALAKAVGGVTTENRGVIQLNLSSGAVQTLSNRHLDRYSSDRIQILPTDISGGISATVDLAKLTALGTDGSLTVVNGIITAYTAPT